MTSIIFAEAFLLYFINLIFQQKSNFTTFLGLQIRKVESFVGKSP